MHLVVLDDLYGNPFSNIHAHTVVCMYQSSRGQLSVYVCVWAAHWVTLLTWRHNLWTLIHVLWSIQCVFRKEWGDSVRDVEYILQLDIVIISYTIFSIKSCTYSVLVHSLYISKKVITWRLLDPYWFDLIWLANIQQI